MKILSKYNYVYQKLIDNLSIIYSFGVVKLDICTDKFYDDVDLEFSAIFDNTYQLDSYYAFSDFIDELFPDYTVELWWQNFPSENTLQNVNNTISIPLIKPTELNFDRIKDIVTFHI